MALAQFLANQKLLLKVPEQPLPLVSKSGEDQVAPLLFVVRESPPVLRGSYYAIESACFKV